MSNEYVLTLNIKKILEGRKKRLFCRDCGEPLEIGETIVSKNNGLDFYHKECYEALFR